MTDIVNMTADQVRAMNTDELIEAIAQMLYDKAEYAGRSSDTAINSEIAKMYEGEEAALCAAAEYVRALLRD